MAFDGIAKLLKIQPVIKAMGELGYPDSLTITIGVVGLTCTILYAIPQTSVLGAILLTGFLHRLIEALLPGSVEIITPGAPEERGCQLSLRIARPAHDAKRCHQRLTAAGVIGDWREPDIVRLAPTPLYNSYSDVFAAVDTLSREIGT